MLFLAYYTVDLANVELAMAKRLEFEELKPEGMRIVCEYSTHGTSSPYGFLVFEADDPAVLNFLIMYYGKTVALDIRPCSDVLDAIGATQKSLSQMRNEDDGA